MYFYSGADTSAIGETQNTVESDYTYNSFYGSVEDNRETDINVDMENEASYNGNTIMLNRFFFDDSSYLKHEYSKMVEKGYFPRGTDYRNIFDHEIGHLIAKRNPFLVRRVAWIVKQMATKIGIDVGTFIKENISEYALVSEGELFAEMYSMLNGQKPGIAQKIWSEVMR